MFDTLEFCDVLDDYEVFVHDVIGAKLAKLEPPMTESDILE